MSPLRAVDEGIWTLSGDPIRFWTFPFQLRSTLVDLGHALFVHSPVQIAAAAPHLRGLPAVGYVVSPNRMHDRFIAEWGSAFPAARLYAPPGLSKRRPDIRFSADLGDRPEAEWAASLDQRVVRGSVFMDEVVFFHRSSGTLILGDLVENHDPQGLDRLQRWLARWNAVLAPTGSTGRNYRMTFLKRNAARETVREMIAWNPRRIIVVHGTCIEDRATDFLRSAFSWLL